MQPTPNEEQTLHWLKFIQSFAKRRLRDAKRAGIHVNLDVEDLVQSAAIPWIITVRRIAEDPSLNHRRGPLASRSMWQALNDGMPIMNLPMALGTAVRALLAVEHGRAAKRSDRTFLRNLVPLVGDDPATELTPIEEARLAELRRLVIAAEARPLTKDDLQFASPTEEAFDPDELALIRPVLATLDERERTVLSLRFGFDDYKELTLASIATMFGISRERVRQIESSAMLSFRDRFHTARTHGLEFLQRWLRRRDSLPNLKEILTTKKRIRHRAAIKGLPKFSYKPEEVPAYYFQAEELAKARASKKQKGKKRGRRAQRVG